MDVVDVHQCSISNVMVTRDIEALLYREVHAVLECYKHTRCFIEPIQLLHHPGLDYMAGSHSLWVDMLYDNFHLEI